MAGKTDKFDKIATGEALTESVMEKMSKSAQERHQPGRGHQGQYGADTFRLYEMFMGPLEVSKPWSTQGSSA